MVIIISVSLHFGNRIRVFDVRRVWSRFWLNKYHQQLNEGIKGISERGKRSAITYLYYVIILLCADIIANQIQRIE